MKTNLRDMDDKIKSNKTESSDKSSSGYYLVVPNEGKKDQITEPIQEESREEFSPSLPKVQKKNNLEQELNELITPTKPTPLDLNKKLSPKDFTLTKDVDSPAKGSDIPSSVIGHIDSVFGKNLSESNQNTPIRARGISGEDKLKSPPLKNSPITMPDREPLKKSNFVQGSRSSPSGSKVDKKSQKDSVRDSVVVTPTKLTNLKRFSLLGDSLGVQSPTLVDRRSSVMSPFIKDGDQPSMLPSFMLDPEDSKTIMPEERNTKKHKSILMKKKTIRPKSNKSY